MSSSSLLMARRRRNKTVVVAAAASLYCWSSSSSSLSYNGLDVVAYVPQLGISVYSPASRLYNNNNNFNNNAFSFSAGPPPSGDDQGSDKDGEDRPFFGSYQGPPGQGTPPPATSSAPPPTSPAFKSDAFDSFFPSSPTGAGPNPFGSGGGLGGGAFPQSATGAGPNPFSSSQQQQQPAAPSPSDDPYYQQKIAQMDAKEQARKDAASRGLQEKTFQKLQQLEQERMLQREQQRQVDDFERSVDAIIQDHRDHVPPSSQQQQEMQQRERNAISQAAEAARIKAEELRREWEAQHPLGSPATPGSNGGGFGSSNTWAGANAATTATGSNNPFASMGGQQLSSPVKNIDNNPFATMGGVQPTRPAPSGPTTPAGNNNPFAAMGGQSSPPPAAASNNPFSSNMDASSGRAPSSSTNPFASSGGNPFASTTPPAAGSSPNSFANQPPSKSTVSSSAPVNRTPVVGSGGATSNPFASNGGQSSPPTPGNTNPFASTGGQSSSGKVPQSVPAYPFGSNAGQNQPSKPDTSPAKSIFNFFGGKNDDTTDQSTQINDSNPGPSVFNVFGTSSPNAVPPPVSSLPTTTTTAAVDTMEEENRRREEAKARFRAQQSESVNPFGAPSPNTTPATSTASQVPPLQPKQQESGSGLPSYADTDEFKRRQEAAIRQQEAEEKEATRLRMLEAKRREQEANIRRFETERKSAMEDPARKAALDEEMKRREAIRQKEDAQRKVVEETNRISNEAEEKRRSAEAARQARMEVVQKMNLEQAEKEKLLAEEKRRKMQEARENAIRAARQKAEAEKKAKEEAEKNRKLEEAERTQAARMKAETKRYKAEAETSRQEIRNFVESKGRRLQQQQQQQQFVQDDDQFLQNEIELRAEEARRWAEQEARRKTGGLPPATDFAGAPAPVGRFPPPKVDPESMRVRNVYAKWCNFYGKRFDERRLRTFSENLYEIESHYSDTGEPVQLNEFADLTAEEYELREQDPFLWEENELVRWAEDEQMRLQGLPPLWDEQGAPYDMYGDLEDDAWRRDEAEWGGPTRRKPLQNNKKAPPSPQGAAPVDAARYRGEFDSERKAELKAKREEEEKKLKEEEERRLEEAKLRGEELAKKKEAIAAKRAAEEDEAKTIAFEEAQRRGEEEAKRRAELEAKNAEEEMRLEEAQRRLMEDAKMRGQSMRGGPSPPFVGSYTNSVFGPDRADAGIGQEGNQVLGRKNNIQLSDDTQRRMMNPPSSDMTTKGIDAWQAALLRGEEEALQRALLEDERRKEQVRAEEEKKLFNENVTERARREAAMRQDAAAKAKHQEEEAQRMVLDEAKRRAQDDQRKREEIMAKQQYEMKKKAEEDQFNERVADRARQEAAMRQEAAVKAKQREEEAQKLVLEQARRRAQEDQRKREEMMAKQQEEMKKRAEIERMRKEEAARIAEETDKKRREEQTRIQEQRARQMETERIRREESKRLAMEAAKRKAEEVARQQEERINLAKLQQERMEQARRDAAEKARIRAQEVEQLKVAQMKRAEEDNKRRETARKEAIAQRRSQQETMEAATLASRREAALQMARAKAEKEETERQSIEEEQKAQRQAPLRNTEGEQRRLAAHEDDKRDRAEKEQIPLMDAAAQNKGNNQTGKPFEKPKPKAPGKTSPFGSYMSTIDQPMISSSGFSAIPPPLAATSGIPSPENKPKGSFSVIPPPQAASDTMIQSTPGEIQSSPLQSGGPDASTSTASVSSATASPSSGTPAASLDDPQKNWNPFSRSKPQGGKPEEGSIGPSYLVDAAKAKQEETARVGAAVTTNLAGSDSPKSYSPFGAWKDKPKTVGAGMKSFTDSMGSAANADGETNTYESAMPPMIKPPISAKDLNQPKKSFAPFGRKPTAASSSGIPSPSDQVKSASFDPFPLEQPQAPPAVGEAEKTQQDGRKVSYNPFGGWKEKTPATGNGMSTFIDSIDSVKASENQSSTPDTTVIPEVSSAKERPKKSYNPFGGYRTPQAGSGMSSYADQVTGKAASFTPLDMPTLSSSSTTDMNILQKTSSAGDRPKSYAPYGSKPKPVAGSGMPSYTDQVTGTADNFSVSPAPAKATAQDKSKSYAPYGFKPKPVAGSGMPSYTDQVSGTADSFSVSPAPAIATTQDQLLASFTIPTPQSRQSKDISGITSTTGTTTGMPSYMDQVGKSYVDQTAKLNELRNDIARMENQVTDVNPPQQIQSQPGGEKENDTGVPGFLNRFFGGKQQEQPPMAQTSYQQTTDGNSKKLKNAAGLPFFMSGSASSSDIPSGTPGGETIPTITLWGQTSEGSIYGFISGSTSFEDGAYIMTSPVDQGARGGSIVTTASGSRYLLADQPVPSK